MTKQELMKKWIEAMESGNYAASSGALKDDKPGYCCLGVADEVCFNATFTQSQVTGDWTDDVGMQFFLTNERAEVLGLLTPVTEEEEERIREEIFTSSILSDGTRNRQVALAEINDATEDFSYAVNILRELEWDNV